MNQGISTMFSATEKNFHYADDEQRIKENIEALRQTLDSSQKKLLLRIIDDKDLICEKVSQDYYKEGFRDAAVLMIDCLYEE